MPAGSPVRTRYTHRTHGSDWKKAKGPLLCMHSFHGSFHLPSVRTTAVSWSFVAQTSTRQTSQIPMLIFTAACTHFRSCSVSALTLCTVPPVVAASQSIGGLSSQSTARFGNVLGVGGVALGLAATVGLMYHAGVPPEVFAQMAALMGIGGVAGYAVAGKVRDGSSFGTPRRMVLSLATRPVPPFSLGLLLL